MLLSSNLVRTSFVFLTWPMQPNVWRKDTLGFASGLGGRAVEDEHRRGHRLSPELCQHTFGLHHGLSHADHRLIPLLHHAVLLW